MPFEGIFKFIICKLNLFLRDPLEAAITWILQCVLWLCINWLIWTFLDSWSLWLNSIFNEPCIFQHSQCWSLLCLRWHSGLSACYSSCGLKSCYLMPKYLVYEMEILEFSLESPSSVSTHYCPNAWNSVNLWSDVFSIGIQRTIISDHLDNAGFNVIAKSSLLESIYIINQEKQLSKQTSWLECYHFLYMGLFCFIFAFWWLYLNVYCL